MNSRLRVAVVGLGIGQEHLRHWRSLSDLFEVILVCDPDEARLRTVCSKLDCAATISFDEVLESEADIIDICTPPHLHFDMASRALRSGFHVVCEKPLVNSLYEVDELIRIEAETDRKCMPISQYRFGSGIQRLKYLVDQKVLGDAYIASIETHWNRGAHYYLDEWRGKWETERGGVLLCHALHLHDLMCFVLGEVESVFARASTRVNPVETEDCASLSLEMKNGALVSSSATLGSRVEISRLRFCFENLTAESALEPYNPGKDPWTMTATNKKQDRRIAEALRNFSPPATGFTGQFLSLYESIHNGEPLAVSLVDARRSLELVTASYSSVRSEQVQRLPILSSHDLYRDWRIGMSGTLGGNLIS